MSLKLKALSLGLLAAVAIAAFAGVTASANNREGHFVTTGTGISIIRTTQGGPHTLEFEIHNFLPGMICDKHGSEVQNEKETENELILFLEFADCYTTNNPGQKFPITAKNCPIWLFAAKGTTPMTEQTVKFDCIIPIEIHHPLCTIKIPAQDNLTGVTYTPILINGKHAITLDANIKYNAQFEAGVCTMMGTNQTGTLKGSLTIEAFNLAGEQANLTAT
jgi:hypothetical protein